MYSNPYGYDDPWQDVQAGDRAEAQVELDLARAERVKLESQVKALQSSQPADLTSQLASELGEPVETGEPRSPPSRRRRTGRRQGTRTSSPNCSTSSTRPTTGAQSGPSTKPATSPLTQSDSRGRTGDSSEPESPRARRPRSTPTSTAPPAWRTTRPAWRLSACSNGPGSHGGEAGEHRRLDGQTHLTVTGHASKKEAFLWLRWAGKSGPTAATPPWSRLPRSLRPTRHWRSRAGPSTSSPGELEGSPGRGGTPSPRGEAGRRARAARQTEIDRLVAEKFQADRLAKLAEWRREAEEELAKQGQT